MTEDEKDEQIVRGLVGDDYQKWWTTCCAQHLAQSLYNKLDDKEFIKFLSEALDELECMLIDDIKYLKAVTDSI